MQSEPLEDENATRTLAQPVPPAASSLPSSPTLRDRPTGTGTLSASLVRNPLEALRLDEIRRTRVFATFIVILIPLVALALPILGGDPFAKVVHGSGLVVGIGGALWVLWVLRDTSRYGPYVNMVFGYCCVYAVATGYYFWGVHSAVMLMVPIGIYVFALAESFGIALSTLIVALVPHLVLSLLPLLGVGKDPGLIQPLGATALDVIGVSLLVQFVCLGAFVMARGLRRSTLDTMEQLDRAVREVAQRNALLHEAREDLDRALKIGAAGRFTGSTLGSFELGDVLGRGSMGDVYEGVHRTKGTRAAVKVLHAAAAGEPDRVTRFRRELEIAASLEAPNLVKVLEVAERDSGVPYLVMERLVGKSLSEVLRERPRMAPAEVASMVAQLAAGIEVAHRAGVVHRDLKPQNIFRHEPGDGRRIWKILDFGVSQLQDSGGTLTRGHVVGTPTYMAPEQARGRRVDQRADVYALGVVAYRALVGRPAFAGGDVPAILHAVVYDMPPRPSRVAPLEAPFDAVLAVALAKEPDERFQTAAELAEALRSAVENRVPEEVAVRAEKILARQAWVEGAA